MASVSGSTLTTFDITYREKKLKFVMEMAISVARIGGYGNVRSKQRFWRIVVGFAILCYS